MSMLSSFMQKLSNVDGQDFPGSQTKAVPIAKFTDSDESTFSSPRTTEDF